MLESTITEKAQDMKQRTKISLAFLIGLIAVGIHGYLTVHFFDLNFGLLEGSSICNLSAKFNCDTVTASSFASLLGIPIALWGAVTNGALALLLLVWLLGWSENIPRLGRYTLWLSGFIAATSLVMGSISTFYIRSFCVFCMSEYLMSFLIFGLIWSGQEPSRRPATQYVIDLFRGAKGYLGLLVAIPLVTFLVNRSILDHYGATQLPELINESIMDWQSAPQVSLSVPPLLVSGSPHPSMTVAEFADFRCPHCRHAVGPVEAFMNSHPDVQLQFYAFPLDGTCNEASGGGDGISCYLARTVFCAEQLKKQGWALHHYIYDHQIEIDGNQTMGFAQDEVNEFLKQRGIDEHQFATCVQSPSTDSAIRDEARLGNEVGVKGTPTFFVNNRMLSRGSLIPILEAVHSQLTK